MQESQLLKGQEEDGVVGKERLINSDLAYYSVLDKSFLKSQIFTTNSASSRLCLPGNILCPFRVYRSGRIMRNEMVSTLNLHLHIIIAVLCFPSLETAIMRRVRRWEKVALVFVQSPLEHMCPFCFVSVSARVPARSRWHTPVG